MSVNTTVRSFVDEIRDKYDFSYDRENIFVIFLRNNTVVYNRIVARGTKTQATMDIKKVLKAGILGEADTMILLHNHTSNNLNPSVNDMETTEVWVNLCYLLDIRFMAHIIFNQNNENLIYYN